MMKLFISPGACSMSCHIVLEETQLPFELAKISWAPEDPVRKTLFTYNPAGAVPTLVLSNGKVLTQNMAILEYIADQKPSAELLAPVGTFERVEIIRWLSLVASDLHKAFSPLFNMERITKNSEAQADIKTYQFQQLDRFFGILNSQLEKNSYLSGEKFSIADAYLFPVYRWSKSVKFPMDKYTALNQYHARLAERPSIQKVLEREGLSI